MDDLLIVVGGACLMIITGVVAREWLRRDWLKELASLAIAETNRNRLGALRTQLMAHAREGRIDIRSPIFGELYGLLTVLMRHPEDYAAVAQRVLDVPDIGPGLAPSNWRMSQHEGQMLLAVADAMDRLCRDYNPVFKRLARLYDWVTRKHPNRVPFFVRFSMAMAERTPAYRQSVEPVKKATQRLASWGGHPEWRGGLPDNRASAHA